MYGGGYYGEEGDEDEEGEDYDDEDEEEEDEEEEDRGGSMIFNSTNMSPDLLLALGLIDKIERDTKSDWVPPSTAGLMNSDRILDVKNRGLNLDVKADSKTTGSILMDSVRAAAKAGGDLPVQAMGLPIRAEAKESYSNTVVENDMLEEEEDFSEEEVLDPEFETFYDDIVQGKKNLKGDDVFWEMKSQLNASLGKLFGKYSQEVDSSSVNWDRPKTYGLKNSEPIIKTTFNQFKEEVRAEEKVRDAYIMYNDSQSKWSSNAADNKQDTPMYKNEEEEYEEDDEEDDNEDDGDYEDYDYEEANTSSNTMFASMSPNLMMALGLTVDTPQVTDWVPPSRSGLEYSDRKYLPLVNVLLM